MLLDNVFGDGFSNGVRFAGVLEKLITGIRAYNFAMEGFAPNQQCLCCQEMDIEFEHDLIIIAPAIETIRKLGDSLLIFKKGIISL